jgi:hypothetical protein
MQGFVNAPSPVQVGGLVQVDALFFEQSRGCRLAGGLECLFISVRDHLSIRYFLKSSSLPALSGRQLQSHQWLFSQVWHHGMGW